MFSLGHIQPPIEKFSGFRYFITITLPKCHYKKGALKQSEVMDNMFRRIAANLFEEAYVSYELTLKGNIHAHAVIKVREFFEGITFDNEQAQDNANIKILSQALKQYSNSDVQRIKNVENVYKYLYKEIDITQRILGKSPMRYYGRPATVAKQVAENAEWTKYIIKLNEELLDNKQ